MDDRGNLYICDIGNHRIRRVNLKSGTISTFAGTGEKKPTPDGASLAGTPLNGPRALDYAGNGQLVLALREGNAVYRIDLDKRTLHHVAGTEPSQHDDQSGAEGPEIFKKRFRHGRSRRLRVGWLLVWHGGHGDVHAQLGRVNTDTLHLNLDEALDDSEMVRRRHMGYVALRIGVVACRTTLSDRTTAGVCKGRLGHQSTAASSSNGYILRPNRV